MTSLGDTVSPSPTARPSAPAWCTRGAAELYGAEDEIGAEEPE